MNGAILLLLSLFVCFASAQTLSPNDAAAVDAIRLALGSPSNWSTGNPCTTNWRGWICSSNQITQLNIINQTLVGSLPTEIGLLTNLVQFTVSGIPSLSGPLPSSVGALTRLSTFILSSLPSLSGQLPTQLGLLTSVNTFVLSSLPSLTGTLPTHLGMMRQLSPMTGEFTLNELPFTGTIPTELGMLRMTTYSTFRITNSAFSGSLPSQLSFLFGLSVSQWSARLELNNLPNIVGTLPSQYFGINASYSEIRIGNMTQLTGILPAAITSRSSTIVVDNTQVFGPIPVSFAQQSSLQLSLTNSRFNGTLPSYTFSISLLNFANNSLSGSLPSQLVSQFSSCDINLSRNQLNGTLPASIFGSTNYIRSLDVSFNRELTGTIPSQVGTGWSLNTLVLRNCSFNGTFPFTAWPYQTFGYLRRLDIANNQFSGPLPANMTNFPMLQYLDISGNRINGTLPTNFEVYFKSRLTQYCSVSNNDALYCPAVIYFTPFFCSCEVNPNQTTVVSNTTFPPTPAPDTSVPTPPPSSNSEPLENSNNQGTSSAAVVDLTIPLSVGVGGGAFVILVCVLVAVCFVINRRRKAASKPKQTTATDNTNYHSLGAASIGSRHGSHKDIDDSIYAAMPSNVPRSSEWKVVTSAPSDLPDNVLVINASELDFQQVIGEGSFGQVWRGRWRSSLAAIKQVKASTMDDKSLDDFWKEASLVANIRPHANIVQFFGVCLQPLCVVNEFLPRGNLRAYLDAEDNVIDNSLVVKWIQNTALGLMHLTYEGIVHRDLAARNVLLTTTLDAKISDFGMSRKLNNDNAHRTDAHVGPLKWMAPESLLESVFTAKTDVWAFGITIIEILTRQPPYPTIPVGQVAAKVVTGELSPTLPPWTSIELVTLLNRCFQRDPAKRIETKELVTESQLLSVAITTQSIAFVRNSVSDGNSNQYL